MHSNGGHEVPCLPKLLDKLYGDKHPVTIQQNKHVIQGSSQNFQRKGAQSLFQ